MRGKELAPLHFLLLSMKSSLEVEDKKSSLLPAAMDLRNKTAVGGVFPSFGGSSAA